MRRGTTPTITLKTVKDGAPYDMGLASSDKVVLTIRQGETEIDIDKARMTFGSDPPSAQVTLTQGETLQLSAGIDVQLQIRRVNQGAADATSVASVPVDAILKDGVL